MLSAKPITKPQIKLIKMLQRKRGIEDAPYREMLETHFGVTTCKALTRREAHALLTRLGAGKRTKPKPKPKPRPRREPLPPGVTALPSPAQRGLIGELVRELEWRSAHGYARWLVGQHGAHAGAHRRRGGAGHRGAEGDEAPRRAPGAGVTERAGAPLPELVGEMIDVAAWVLGSVQVPGARGRPGGAGRARRGRALRHAARAGGVRAERGLGALRDSAPCEGPAHPGRVRRAQPRGARPAVQAHAAHGAPHPGAGMRGLAAARRVDAPGELARLGASLTSAPTPGSA